jgi:hypothetical protein
MLDEMTTEEIIKALNTPAPLFIPENLLKEYNATINALGMGIVGVDTTIGRWRTIIPPPEMAILHGLNLGYFQSLRRQYEASLEVKRSMVENGEIDPISQAKVELSLDQISDSLTAVKLEFDRVSSEYYAR